MYLIGVYGLVAGVRVLLLRRGPLGRHLRSLALLNGDPRDVVPRMVPALLPELSFVVDLAYPVGAMPRQSLRA